MRMRIASDVGGHVHRQHRLRSRLAPHQRLQGADDAAGARARHRREPAPHARMQLGADGGAVDYVGHGMTTATNAVIQRSGRQDRLRHQPRLPRPAADRAAGPAEPVRHRRGAHAAAGAARAELRHRRAHGRSAGARSSRSTTAALEQAAADMRAQGVEAVAVVLPARLRQPRARARGQGGARAGRCPASSVCISTDILREFREFERASTTVLNAFLTPVMDQLPGLAVGAAASTARAGSASRRDKPIMVMEAVGRADDGGVGARQAGAHGAVGAGGRRRRRRAFRRADRRRRHHHHGYRRHQHRHQPDPQRPAGDDAAAPRSARSRSGCR